MYKKQLEGFPKEVVELMLDRQVEQGNDRDVSVFENNNTELSRGFRWIITKEGKLFWNEVIRCKNFDLFFKKYPKSDTNKSNPYAIDALEGYPIEVIDLMIIRYIEDRNRVCKYYESITTLKHLQEGCQFAWCNTIEGDVFWAGIDNNKFDVFYKKYPNYIIKYLNNEKNESNKKNGVADSKSSKDRTGRVRVSRVSRQVTTGKSYIGYAKRTCIKKARIGNGRLRQDVRRFQNS